MAIDRPRIVGAMCRIPAPSDATGRQTPTRAGRTRRRSRPGLVGSVDAPTPSSTQPVSSTGPMACAAFLAGHRLRIGWSRAGRTGVRGRIIAENLGGWRGRHRFRLRPGGLSGQSGAATSTCGPELAGTDPVPLYRGLMPGAPRSASWPTGTTALREPGVDETLGSSGPPPMPTRRVAQSADPVPLRPRSPRSSPTSVTTSTAAASRRGQSLQARARRPRAPAGDGGSSLGSIRTSARQ
jgi:hypothetical protein